MRLRHIKGADIILDSIPFYISDPSIYKGKWRSEVFKNNNPLHIEIGCGKGKFLLEMAKNYPDVNFIGIEKFDSILIRTGKKLLDSNLPNVRILLYDAADLENVFCNQELNLIYLNFSDPWPKKKQNKRRLTAPSFLDIYKNILSDDGAIYQKTDNRFLFAYSLEKFNEMGFSLSNITLDLHNDTLDFVNITTEFEEKWMKLGPIYRLEARKKEL